MLGIQCPLNIRHPDSLILAPMSKIMGNFTTALLTKKNAMKSKDPDNSIMLLTMKPKKLSSIVLICSFWIKGRQLPSTSTCTHSDSFANWRPHKHTFTSIIMGSIVPKPWCDPAMHTSPSEFLTPAPKPYPTSCNIPLSKFTFTTPVVKLFFVLFSCR